MIRKPIVELNKLNTGYHSANGNIIVSEDINETLYSGELTCLLGPNGSGKSTILKTLSGFIPKLGGEIKINGKRLDSYSDQDLSKVISVVLTDRVAIDNMNVRDLVSLGRSPYTGFWGILTNHDQVIVDESISLVGIDNLRSRIIRTLSDGERQKVMIAKALAQETPVIYLDEPTAFLDYPSKAEILQLLQNISRERQKTILVSTHDLELALQIADKIWLMDKRYGLQTGTPEDLALSGEIAKYFERDGMVFDPSLGTFKINTSIFRRIYVSGTGLRRNLIEKSFARNGLGIDSNPENELVVKIQNEGYSFRGITVCSVGDLTDLVCDYLSTNEYPVFRHP